MGQRDKAPRERTWAEMVRHPKRSGILGSRFPVRGVFSVIAALYLIVATGAAAAAVHFMHDRSTKSLTFGYARPAAPLTARTPKYLVLMVLDGGRSDYFGLTSLPHVDALRRNGSQFTDAMAGILEAETPSGHTTLATGSTPAKDGILGFNWGQNDADYSLFNPDVVRAGAMTNIMEAAGVPTLAGLYKARFPEARVVALSGHKYYAADPLGGPKADAIMYYQGSTNGRYVPVSIPGHAPPAAVLNAPGLIWPTSSHLKPGTEDTLVTRLALSAVRVMRPRMLLINYPEFDWPLGHVRGGNVDPRAVEVLMKNYDADLGRIEAAYRKRGILKQTLFVITADHGMMPTGRFIPPAVVTDAISRAGTTAPATSSSTGSYIWLANAAMSRTVAANIWAAKDPGIESVYYLTIVNGKMTYELGGGSFVSPEVNVTNRYLLQTLMNGHQPNVVAFARAGNTFQASSSHWKADHGGASWASEHIPLILSGPGIRPGVVTAKPAQLDDVAPTVLRDMGVAPTGMQGKALTDALIRAAEGTEAARSAEVTVLTPMVQSLIAQENYEQATP